MIRKSAVLVVGLLLLTAPVCNAAIVSFEFYGQHLTYYGEAAGIEEYGAETYLRFDVDLADIADNGQSQLPVTSFLNFESFTFDTFNGGVLHSYTLFDLTGSGGLVVERFGNSISVLEGFGLFGETSTDIFGFDTLRFNGQLVFYSDALDQASAAIATYGTALGEFTTEVKSTSVNAPSNLLIISLSLLFSTLLYWIKQKRDTPCESRLDFAQSPF